VIVDESGNNMIVIDPGANEEMTVGDVDGAVKVISEAELLLLQLESPPEVSFYAAQLAKKKRNLRHLEPCSRKTDFARAVRLGRLPYSQYPGI